jgi:hypothetical protein
MNYNSRYKAIEDFITAFKINKKVYVEKQGLKWLRDIKTKSSHPVKIKFIPEIFVALPEADEVSNAL